MKRLAFLSLLLLLVTAACAQESPLDNGNFKGIERVTNQYFLQHQQTREVEVLRAEPIFENAPFLKLRAGDQLVRSEIYQQRSGKGVTNAPYEWTTPYLHLKRGSKLMRIDAYEQEGRLLEPAPRQVPLFRWELTRANAEALFRICQPKPSLSVEQLMKLDAALQTDYAEYLGEDLNRFLNHPENVSTGFLRIVGEGAEQKFVYGGFAYDTNAREVFQYRLTLGANAWELERATLITAPPKPRVPMGPQQMTFLTRRTQPEKPKTPQEIRLQAQIANWEKFDAIIRGVAKNELP